MRCTGNIMGNTMIVALLLIGICGICPLIASGQLPLEPSKQTGQNVTAAYEGWVRNADENHGVAIVPGRGADVGVDRLNVYGPDCEDPEKRPKLTIRYVGESL